MQKLILTGSHSYFVDSVNEMLQEGWKVVPGTQYITSLRSGEMESGAPMYQWSYSIALEKEDETTKAEHDKKQDEVAKWTDTHYNSYQGLVPSGCRRATRNIDWKEVE